MNITSVVGSLQPLFSGIVWLATRKVVYIPFVAVSVIVILGEQYSRARDSIKRPISRYVGTPLSYVVLGVTRAVSWIAAAYFPLFSSFPYHQARLEDRMGTGQGDAWRARAANAGEPRAICERVRGLPQDRARSLLTEALRQQPNAQVLYELAKLQEGEEAKASYKRSYELSCYPAGLAYAKLLGQADAEYRTILIDVAEHASEKEVKGEARYLLAFQTGTSRSALKSKRYHLRVASSTQYAPAYTPLATMYRDGVGGKVNTAKADKLDRLALGTHLVLEAT